MSSTPFERPAWWYARIVTKAAVRLLDDDAILLRRTGVRFPVELRPAGFKPDDFSSWPDADGRLEWVEGRLLYMPPCADTQQDVAADVIHVLRSWAETHAEFVIGANEAGMKLGEDIRAADAAIWRGADVGRSVGKLRRAPPLLAVEIAGEHEDEQSLREKARWYLTHRVAVVWIVLPEQREVLVMQQPNSESRHSRGERLPMAAPLPDLAPRAEQFFVQLDR